MVKCTVDLAAEGKHFGELRIPISTNTSGWSQLVVPAVSIRNGGGPTVLVTGGNHGDEPEGQILALNLAEEVRPAAVSGHLIIVPCLSMRASAAGTRLWPGGANFNRSFPGSPEGSPDEQLADFVTRSLLPISDVVIDIHSGGRPMVMYPMGNMHLVRDIRQRRAMLESLLAWNLDYLMVYIDVAGAGLLAGEAERQGKIVSDPELGGGGYVSRRLIGQAERGLRNVLRHSGVLSGPVESREALGLPPTTILAALDEEDYVFAPESGLYEALADPGAEVAAGEVVGRLHFLERPDRPAVPITTPVAGVVGAVRAINNTAQGDCVALVCQKVDVDTVMAARATAV